MKTYLVVLAIIVMMVVACLLQEIKSKRYGITNIEIYIRG